jgi:Na+-driven multidrug efflux pump
MGMERNFSQLVLMWFMVPFGTLAVAAHSLNQRIEMLLFMPAWGFGIAAGVLAGQNLGTGQPERAERSGWLAAGLAEGFMLACSLAILLWAEGIIHIFTSEPSLVELSSIFLRIAVAGYVVMAFTAVLQQCISGAGDTLPPMLFTLLGMFMVQVPLAWFLPRTTNLGIYGVRWAIVAGTVVTSVAYIVYFRLGRWKRKKV